MEHINGAYGRPPLVTSRGPGAGTGAMEGPEAGLADIGQDLEGYNSDSRGFMVI